MDRDPDQPISPEEFMRLFLRSQRDIFRYVAVLVPNADDAQDIVQETAVALWKKLDQYDSGQPFTAWACRFALIEARQYARKRQRWPALLDAELVEQLVQRRGELAACLDRRREYLSECLARLSVDQRRIVERYYYERMSVEVIASRMGPRKMRSTRRCSNRRVLSDCVERKLRSEGAAS